ncbi:MAG: acyloxyacyl hydrolase [Candidatus Kapabacteria bacterium]|nr:acyloxyacyl hydrolase [Candidatus Kapabacteria bacterium]
MIMFRRYLFLCLAIVASQHASAQTWFASAGPLATEIFDRDKISSLGWELIHQLPNSDLEPMAGLVLTATADVYVYAGASYALPLFEGIDVLPSFAVGAYGRGRGPNLGTVVEFRSGMSLRLQLPARAFVTVGLHHLSNGGFHRGRNPGTEIVSMMVGIPLR